jgi:hypothetical protein
MIEARTLSGQVPLIDHNDIVEMLHGPIYIENKLEVVKKLQLPP